MTPETIARRRLHLVLVPGFAGFDALGQLDYYAGITPLFREWKRDAERHAGVSLPVALHYFDSYPTAGVATRAWRLENYLAKRIERGEIAGGFRAGEGDLIALIAHSTGGLDIRRLLWDLAAAPGDALPSDGFASGERLRAGDMLDMVKRAVFISVPQWGTNLADWVARHPRQRRLFLAQLRTAISTARWSITGVRDWVMERVAALTGSDLALAIADAVSEADDRSYRQALAPQAAGAEVSRPVGTREARRAMADEAASELSLWLRHITTDFGAIEDLQSACGRKVSLSPAHFDTEHRAAEMGQWRAHGILTRSYATLGPRVFTFTEGQPAPPLRLTKVSTYPAFRDEAGVGGPIDLVYRWCYRACAGGPFCYPPPGTAPRAAPLGQSHPRTIETWDNDGIVNTASMFWPDGDRTVLVAADHMDIVGHHARADAPAGSGRRYRAYDLLGSGSAFTGAQLRVIWNDIFEFCAGALSASASGAVRLG